MRASLSFSKMNASIWTPKMTSEEIRAVTNATKLMPWEPWPEPTGLASLVDEGLDALVVADMVK